MQCIIRNRFIYKYRYYYNYIYILLVKLTIEVNHFFINKTCIYYGAEQRVYLV